MLFLTAYKKYRKIKTLSSGCEKKFKQPLSPRRGAIGGPHLFKAFLPKGICR
jgi:hypothetical protein